MSATPPRLELRNVDASYGPFRALFGVDLEIGPGSAMALLGANGAGKTTIARVCSGLLPPRNGTVWLDGVDVTGKHEHQFARLGVAHLVEGRSVFATLTVEQNLGLFLRRRVPRANRPAAMERAYGFFPILAERRRQLAGTLSGGEQRMLSLATVLAEPPRLLICDELSLGLAPRIVEAVYDSLRPIRAEGTSLLIVEQEVHHALRLADAVTVLTTGEVAYRGAPSDLDDVEAHILAGGGQLS
jgi:branched-chain amino acid transport system ATP-binding protein